MTEYTTTPLLAAVEAEDLEAVAELLASGHVPTAPSDDTTPFHQACFQGSRAMVTAMLKAGADPNARDPRGYFPLAVVASRDHATLVKRLVDAGAIVDARDGDGGTALHIAAAAGADRAVQALIAAGAGLEITDHVDATAVLYAAMHGRKSTVGVLHDAGASLAHPDVHGRTPLHHAIASAHRRRVNGWRSEGMLGDQEVAYEIRRGEMMFFEADKPGVLLDTKDQRAIAKRVCPAHDAYLDAFDTSVAIMRAGADTAARDNEGVTPVYLAAQMGEARLFHEALKKAGDRPEAIAPTVAGDTLGHAIARSGAVTFMRKIKPKSWTEIDFCAPNNAGQTPLHVVAAEGGEDAVKWITERCSTALAQRDVDGQTPMDVAAQHANLTVAKQLYDQVAFSARLKGQPVPAPPDGLG